MSKEIGYGMQLARYELKKLSENSVRAFPNVTLVTQSTGRTLVRGDESGGAGRAVGHYVGFLPLDQEPFAVVEPIPALMPNAQHRRVWAAGFVRFEVFHYDESRIHTRITLHRCEAGSTPRQVSRVLFEGRYGDVNGGGIARFVSDAGEAKGIPEFLAEGFRRTLSGSRCHGCRHSHLDNVSPVCLPAAVFDAIRQMPAAHHSAGGE
jgi:hypothetical protein